MSKKANTDNFLKKELKALADSKGYIVVDELKEFDEKKVKKVKVKKVKVKNKKKKEYAQGR